VACQVGLSRFRDRSDKQGQPGKHVYRRCTPRLPRAISGSTLPGSAREIWHGALSCRWPLHDGRHCWVTAGHGGVGLRLLSCVFCPANGPLHCQGRLTSRWTCKAAENCATHRSSDLTGQVIAMCRIIAMLLPCYCHVIAVLLPCYCRVIAVFAVWPCKHHASDTRTVAEVPQRRGAVAVAICRCTAMLLP
jgi:hypothetical protein